MGQVSAAIFAEVIDLPAPLPPEWEIDGEVMEGMVGGYRRIRDGARLQKHATLAFWVLSIGRWVIDMIESIDPPLDWADTVLQ